MSRRVPAQQQGRLQGVNSAFMGICSIIGPVIYLTSLQFAVKTEKSVGLPGLPIVIAAGFCIAALVAAVSSPSRSPTLTRWCRRPPQPDAP